MSHGWLLVVHIDPQPQFGQCSGWHVKKNLQAGEPLGVPYVIMNTNVTNNHAHALTSIGCSFHSKKQEVWQQHHLSCHPRLCLKGAGLGQRRDKNDAMCHCKMASWASFWYWPKFMLSSHPRQEWYVHSWMIPTGTGKNTLLLLLQLQRPKTNHRHWKNMHCITNANLISTLFPHPCQAHTGCLTTFIWCGCAYGYGCVLATLQLILLTPSFWFWKSPHLDFCFLFLGYL